MHGFKFVLGWLLRNCKIHGQSTQLEWNLPAIKTLGNLTVTVNYNALFRFFYTC